MSKKRIAELEKAVKTFRSAYFKQKREKVALRVELQQRIDDLEKQVKIDAFRVR